MSFVAKETEVFINKNLLQEFYSSSSKVIISSHDREIFDNNLAGNQEIIVYEFECDINSSESIVKIIGKETKDNPNSLIEAKLAPNFCLGLFSFSQAGKEDLEKLIDWWKQKNSGKLIPDLVELNAAQGAVKLQKEFWQQLYFQRSKQNHSTAQRLVTLQKQYLSLRKLHEEMQNAFSTVEDYLSKAKLPPIQLAFDTQITDKIVEPTKVGNSNSLILKQLLPLPSAGLAAIELHIAQQYTKAVGYLKISLKACEDTSNFVVWKIPYSHLSPGWLSLDLPNIDLGRKRDTELVVEWQTNIGAAPSLSLTKKQPVLESRAYNDNIILENSFAIRMWQGLPGTRKVTSPYLITIREDKKELPQLGYLGQKAITKVQEVTPNLPIDGFEHIQILEDGAKIMTHPRADGTPTIAMLPYCFPPTANQLITSVVTDHPEAGAVEYAIAIIEPEIDPKTALSHDTALGFSNWISIEPNIHREITLDLPTSATQHCHIVIATKLVEGNSIDFAWSHWLNFRTIATQTKITKPQAVKQSKSDSGQTRLRDISLPSLKAEFAKVQLMEKENKIQVHPTLEGNTIAIVSNAIQTGITKVKSIVCTENAAAPTVEYAIAVIDSDDDILGRLSVDSPDSALGFSGWQKVDPNTTQNLELNLNSPSKDTCHLVLATRLPEGSSQTNAWARWLNIECI